MSELPFFWIDAFTRKPLHGNPAAVVPLSAWRDDAWLQAIAAQNGLSETAYFVPRDEQHFDLRWFTPTIEVDLCGHATLAAAHVLYHELEYSHDRVTFSSRGGDLVVRPADDGQLVLNFPARPPREVPIDTVTGTLAALGGPRPLWVGESRDLLIELESAAAVRAVQPDFPALKAARDQAVIVTATGDDHDFVSRFFAPNFGVNEDPVTGSAHCTLTPYWVGRLGKNPLRAQQVSPRGGELSCRLDGDRVDIAGHAVTYIRGKMTAE